MKYLSLIGLSLFLAGAIMQSAQAQPLRAGDTVYGKVGVGLAEYTGDASPSSAPYALGDVGGGPGLPYVLRGEVGYQVMPQIAVGIAGETGNYPFSDGTAQLDNTRSSIQLLGRYTFRAETWKYAPYVDVARTLTIGGGTSNGHGVSVGLGLDVAMTPRITLNVEARRNLLWPDDAVDDLATGASDIDQLGQLLGVGVKANLDRPSTPPRVQPIDGPTTVDAGSTATYTAMLNEDASRPLERTWRIGERKIDTSATMTHTFETPGTYTVTFVATNGGGTARRTLQVEAEEPPLPAQIVSIDAQPDSASVGQPVQFSSQVKGATPRTHIWTFDDTTKEGETATHAYERPGTYTVRFEAENETGADARTLSLQVDRRMSPMAGGLTRTDTEDPLLNVRLTATVAGLDTSITTASRSGGTYLFAGVPAGTVTLRATKAGFTPTEVVVDHTAGDTTETSFTMTPRRETADAIERDLRNEARRVLENVRVKTDSAQIREEAVSTLQAALDVIQERMPETSFVIEGHTDAQGPEEYNEQLSERRADALGMAPGRGRAR